MIIDGKDFGPFPFLVQLRSLEDHKLLPGRQTGSIGPKLGFNEIDNGWARFDRVRVPRTHFLSKYAQVTKEGKFIKPPHEKLA